MKETVMVTKMILSKVIPIMKMIILIMIIVIILVIVMTLRMFLIMIIIIIIIVMYPIFPTYNDDIYNTFLVLMIIKAIIMKMPREKIRHETKMTMIITPMILLWILTKVCLMMIIFCQMY